MYLYNVYNIPNLCMMNKQQKINNYKKASLAKWGKHKETLLATCGCLDFHVTTIKLNYLKLCL